MDSQIQDGRQIQDCFPIFKSKYLSQFLTDLDQNLCAPPLGQAYWISRIQDGQNQDGRQIQDGCPLFK